MTEPLALHAAEETFETVNPGRHTAYPTYKPSGVEWLGDVPEHWDVKRLKWDSAVFRGASPRPIDDPIYFDDDGEYAWVRISDVTTAGTYLRETKQRLSELGASLSVKLAPGDLFLSIAGSVGKPCIAKIKCCIHDGFVYFPRLSCDRKFLYYIFASGEPYKGLGKLGTQLNLNTDTVGSISMAFPPPEEQRAIVRFLDDQTEKIDDLISAKRDLLALLKEKRQAVITHAVTRGLDPAAKLQPSGVEWLGDVPEHWKLKPFKHLTRFLNGMAFKPDQWSDEGYPIIRIENLNGGESFNCFDGYVPDQYHVRQGDLLFGWSGNRGTSFGPFLWWREGLHYLNQHIFKLHSYKCDKSWFYWTLKSLTMYMEEEAHGIIGMVHITKGKLGAVKVPVPPPEEQRAIARFLDEETKKMDDLESVVREAIASLEVLRTSIISAAVTGKIDVRGAKVQTRQ